MKKWFVMFLAVILCLALVLPAMARKTTVTTLPITILGQPCEVVQVIDRGGPLAGLFGTTRVSQVTITKNDGKLIKLSEYGSTSEGVGKVMIQGLPQAAMYGGMNIIAAGAIRPDRTSVNVPVSGVSSASSKQTQGQIGINSQTQGQLQGQQQGQLQGQQQGQTGGAFSPVTNVQ
jgi:hypothetical protein